MSEYDAKNIDEKKIILITGSHAEAKKSGT